MVVSPRSTSRSPSGSVGEARLSSSGHPIIGLPLNARERYVLLTDTTTRTTVLARPAHDTMQEVNTVMNLDTTYGQPSGMSAMRRRASVCALPMSGAMSAVTVAPSAALFDGTRVCTDVFVWDIAVTTGSFPGTSAWSPPI